MAQNKLTPLMEQYFPIKEQFSDALLLFQVGDFYELFFDDAKTAAEFLALTLTKRGKCKGTDIPLCGVPLHALNHYLLKLVRGGFKVAICDQISKPKPGTVVKRKVTRVYTPGTLTDSLMLDDKSASYLFSFWPGLKHWGLVFTELLTSQTLATVLPCNSNRQLESELVRFLPDEILMPRARASEPFSKYFASQGYSVSFANLADGEPDDFQFSCLARNGLDEKWASGEWVSQLLKTHFEVSVCQKLDQMPALACSVGVLGRYLEKNNNDALKQLTDIKFYRSDDYLVLDAATQKNLEIVRNNHDGGRKNTLVSVLDKSKTSMGARMVKKWLLRPLVSVSAIKQRQDVVGAISGSATFLMRLSDLMGRISDLERIVGRIALDRAVVTDFLSLKNSLQVLPQLIDASSKAFKSLSLGSAILKRLHPLPQLVELLSASISEDGGSRPIKDGFDLELDKLRRLVKDSQHEILTLEQRETKSTGIKSLKIRYTDAFGYSIEITNANKNLVPERYVHKQTLVGRCRYITEDLKKLESEILEARERIDAVEAEVFARVKSEVAGFTGQLRETAFSLAVLDGLLSFACVAYDNCYVKPEFNDKRDIVISDGRHPVVEQTCSVGQFIPNDTFLCDDESLWIVTGPNMGGKSTYLRQVALISLMSQVGCFVPAKSASVSILDRIFTRIGSGDNLAAGKSTFLVEMEEAAVICRQATEKSLVILDEVGRGTSTYDGMAIAQAIIEYIFSESRARCLFATHYHELTHLEEKFSGIANYFVTCRRNKNGVVFLHKLAKGVAQGSFGIEVAQLADLPVQVVARARDLLVIMEKGGMPTVCLQTDSSENSQAIERLNDENMRLRAALKALVDSEPDDLTPRQAHDLLCRTREMVKED